MSQLFSPSPNARSPPPRIQLPDFRQQLIKQIDVLVANLIKFRHSLVNGFSQDLPPLFQTAKVYQAAQALQSLREAHCEEDLSEEEDPTDSECGCDEEEECNCEYDA